MNFSVLGSGSKGNSVYIESGSTAILIDAGFSGKEIAVRLQSLGRRVENLNAVFVTHEHQDHIHGVGVISRRFQIPVYSNYGTFKGGEHVLGGLSSYSEFATGD
ncbi:MAG: MBL fold metallo-hydrolase, partial [Desulfocapsaceae bacterium]|nr:MBL fold metallo-hydrolase [Desulfocapsaceae bacterium]